MTAVDPLALRICQLRWKLALAASAAVMGLAVITAFAPVFGVVVPVALILWFFWWAWRTGRSGRIAALCVISALTLFLVALEMRSRAQNSRVEALRVAIESNLAAQLSVGDGPEKIESVLRNSGFKFTYAQDLLGYYASVSPSTPDRRIDIAIVVTNTRQLRQIRVSTFCTSL